MFKYNTKKEKKCIKNYPTHKKKENKKQKNKKKKNKKQTNTQAKKQQSTIATLNLIKLL